MKQKKYTILDFIPMTKGYRIKFFISFFLVILGVLLSYLSPQIVRITVDSVIGTEPFALPNFLVEIIENLGGKEFLMQNLFFCAIASFSLAVMSSLCDFGARSNLVRASEGSLEVVRNNLFSHIQKLPYSWHNKHQTGDIIQRCTMDVDMIKNFISEQFLALFRTVFLILIAL
ncbi:MAG: ABC transporter transmembrane domain-containing protein, partial [Clostridia bacterium]